MERRPPFRFWSLNLQEVQIIVNFGALSLSYKQTGHGPNVILTQIAASGCREPVQRQILCKVNLLRLPGRWRNCGMSTVRRIPCHARPITSRRPHHERFSVDVVIAPRPRLVVGELQNIPQAPGSQCTSTCQLLRNTWAGSSVRVPICTPLSAFGSFDRARRASW